MLMRQVLKKIAAQHRSKVREGGRSGRRSLLWLVLTVLGLLPAGLVLRSQQPAQQPAQASTITAKVNVVNVLATVRNKQGGIIPNLTKNDFLLEEDGRPQTIAYFAHETDLPLTLGLLVDTSGSQRRVLPQERDASYSFLDQMVRVDKDKAFVIHFDHEVELLQDMTSSRQKLQAALALLEAPQRQQYRREGGDSPGGMPFQWPGQAGPGGREGGGRERRGGSMHGGGTHLYDAVYLAANELMRQQQGRKALVVLSDGVDIGSKETLASAVEAAQRADTVVYSILFVDEEGYGGWGQHGMGGMGRRGGMGRYPQRSRPDGKKVLQQISTETGGRMFEVSKKMSVDQIYAFVQEELRNQYDLGYTPDRASAGPAYHKIQLLAKERDLIVQARDGYYTDR